MTDTDGHDVFETLRDAGLPVPNQTFPLWALRLAWPSWMNQLQTFNGIEMETRRLVMPQENWTPPMFEMFLYYLKNMSVSHGHILDSVEINTMIEYCFVYQLDSVYFDRLRQFLYARRFEILLGSPPTKCANEDDVQNQSDMDESVPSFLSQDDLLLVGVHSIITPGNTQMLQSFHPYAFDYRGELFYTVKPCAKEDVKENVNYMGMITLNSKCDIGLKLKLKLMKIFFPRDKVVAILNPLGHVELATISTNFGIDFTAETCVDLLRIKIVDITPRFNEAGFIELRDLLLSGDDGPMLYPSSATEYSICSLPSSLIENLDAYQSLPLAEAHDQRFTRQTEWYLPYLHPMAGGGGGGGGGPGRYVITIPPGHYGMDVIIGGGGGGGGNFGGNLV